MPKGGKSEGQSESEDEARASKKGGDHAVGKRNKRKASIKLPTPDMNEAEKRSLKAGGTAKKKGEGKRGSTSSSGEGSQELDPDEKKRFKKYFRIMMEKEGTKSGRKRGTERHSKGRKLRRDDSSDDRGGSGESTSEGEEEPPLICALCGTPWGEHSPQEAIFLCSLGHHRPLTSALACLARPLFLLRSALAALLAFLTADVLTPRLPASRVLHRSPGLPDPPCPLLPS